FGLWILDQYRQFGADALRSHFVDEIATRSTRSLGLAKRIFEYPLLLVQHYQPLALIALPGAVLLVRRFRANPADRMLLVPVLWCAVPLVLFSLSAAHSARYLFPLLP